MYWFPAGLRCRQTTHPSLYVLSGSAGVFPHRQICAFCAPTRRGRLREISNSQRSDQRSGCWQRSGRWRLCCGIRRWSRLPAHPTDGLACTGRRGENGVLVASVCLVRFGQSRTGQFPCVNWPCLSPALETLHPEAHSAGVSPRFVCKFLVLALSIRHETTLGREKRIAIVDEASRSPHLTQRMLHSRPVTKALETLAALAGYPIGGLP
jgi:hypothetical protein